MVYHQGKDCRSAGLVFSLFWTRSNNCDTLMLWSCIIVHHLLLAKSQKETKFERHCYYFLSYHVRETFRSREETSLRQSNPFGCLTPDDFSAKEMFSMYLLKVPGLAVEEGFPAHGAGEPEQLLCCSLHAGMVTGGFIPVP